MSFAKPVSLFLIVLVPLAALILLWSTKRRRREMARLGTPSLIAELSATGSARRRGVKTGLWFLGLVALVIALARPVIGTRAQTRTQIGVQTMVVLDISNSMLAEDVKPNRLERAKLLIKELLSRQGGSELGLVLFAGAAFVQMPMTSDFDSARSFLNAVGPRTISRQGTALAEGVRVALDGFPAGSASHRVILLLTDGENQEGDVQSAALAAFHAGVTIHAIGIGSPDGAPIPIGGENGVPLSYKRTVQGETVISRLDEATLQQTAEMTGGLYRRADGEAESDILAVIEALNSGPPGSSSKAVGVQRFAGFAAVALMALSADFLIAERRRHDRNRRDGSTLVSQIEAP
jgi:Ca-activated chloride channel family protein